MIREGKEGKSKKKRVRKESINNYRWSRMIREGKKAESRKKGHQQLWMEQNDKRRKGGKR
jgi:hypothetical protein